MASVIRPSYFMSMMLLVSQILVMSRTSSLTQPDRFPWVCWKRPFPNTRFSYSAHTISWWSPTGPYIGLGTISVRSRPSPVSSWSLPLQLQFVHLSLSLLALASSLYFFKSSTYILLNSFRCRCTSICFFRLISLYRTRPRFSFPDHLWAYSVTQSSGKSHAWHLSIRLFHCRQFYQ